MKPFCFTRRSWGLSEGYSLVFTQHVLVVFGTIKDMSKCQYPHSDLSGGRIDV